MKTRASWSFNQMSHDTCRHCQWAEKRERARKFLSENDTKNNMNVKPDRKTSAMNIQFVGDYNIYIQIENKRTGVYSILFGVFIRQISLLFYTCAHWLFCLLFRYEWDYCSTRIRRLIRKQRLIHKFIAIHKCMYSLEFNIYTLKIDSIQ